MLLGIDHVVIAVPDLDRAGEELREALGLEASGGGTHPTLGTKNRLVWLGDTYLELLAIADPDVAADSWLGRPALEAMAAGGGLATWAVATDAIEADVAALRALGARYADPVEGRRSRPDGNTVRWRLALPGRLGPREPPFLIEHDPSSAEWTTRDRAERATSSHPIGGPVRLSVLALPVIEMKTAIPRLARSTALRFRPSLAGSGARDANLGPHLIRLVPDPGDTRPPGVELTTPAGIAKRTVDLLGLRWTLRPTSP
jgi:catechol 2,3-dioxygenase-like lactoylglutathione lyase family enzyme